MPNQFWFLQEALHENLRGNQLVNLFGGTQLPAYAFIGCRSGVRGWLLRDSECAVCNMFKSKTLFAIRHLGLIPTTHESG